MVAIPKKPYITPDEYLRQESEAATKRGYYDGVIVAMAGASAEHNTIIFNLATELGPQLKGSDCRGFSSDMRVRVPECNRYYYPDLAIVCGEPDFEDNRTNSLLNPMVVVEVLSDSTERTDRGEKLICYQTLPSLTTYVLIAQDRPQVEVYRRQERGWLHTVTQGLESAVIIEAVGCSLRLSDIYARVTFPTLEEPDTEEH